MVSIVMNYGLRTFFKHPTTTSIVAAGKLNATVFGQGSKTRGREATHHTRPAKCSLPTSRFCSTYTLSQSYDVGECDVPLVGRTIGQLLTEKYQEHPNKDAVVFPEQNIRLTFKELYEKSLQFAANLKALGIEKGDRVGVWGPNMYQWVIAQYGTALAGVIQVNLNPLYNVSEFEYTAKFVGLKAVVMADNWQGQDYIGMLKKLCPNLVKHGQPDQTLPDLQHIFVMGKASDPGMKPFEDLLSSKGDVEKTKQLQDVLQFDNAINIQFTSGTTGKPKGAVLSHHNIVNNSYLVGRILDYHKNPTVICCPVPLYHCFGMVLGGLCAVTHGATVVFPSTTFDPQASLQAVQDEKCTSLYGVPTMFIDMLNEAKKKEYQLDSLYTGIMAGSQCPSEVMQQVCDKLHMPSVTICYGTTENSPVTFQTRMNHHLEKRVTTIGTPMYHTEVKVIDSEGRVVPVGTPGELCVRGYCVMREYWNQPDKTQEVVGSDRWYKTGDMAVIHPDRFCQIVGRLKDLIIRGGENVYPAEVEEHIHQHKDVLDVQIVGIPDQRMGEELCACVKLQPGASLTVDDVRSFCKERMARFKVPKYVLFMNEFPLTVTGKVQKFILREQVLKLIEESK